MTTKRTRPIARDLQSGFLEPSPQRHRPKIPKVKSGGRKPGRVYHSFFRAQAGSCTSLFFLQQNLARRNGKIFSVHRKHALTKKIVLSNIRFVSRGSAEMLRASRCFRITLLQSDGPLTLAADALSPCPFHSHPIGWLRDRGAARNLTSALFGFLFDDGFCGAAPSPLQ